VEGYVICDRSGTCLRQGSPTGSMPGDIASRYADAMQTLAQKARHVVRDLDPAVSGRAWVRLAASAAAACPHAVAATAARAAAATAPGGERDAWARHDAPCRAQKAQRRPPHAVKRLLLVSWLPLWGAAAPTAVAVDAAAAAS
jgi:hypothetical protein